MLRYLAVLAVILACFTGDVSAVTDEQFQELSSLVRSQAARIDVLEQQLKVAQDSSGTEIIQNTTIEERVALLEIQMTDVQEDITEINQDVTDLDEDVSLLFENDNFLFDEQVIQDERLFSLEEENDQIDAELDQIEDDIESLEDTTLALDFRVTVLEETGGNGGNSSIIELEERVEILEGTAADHETRITSAEENVDELESSNADLEARLTAAEENIQGLQMADISLDARITALEENGGGGGSQNDTIAFYAALTSYDTIPDDSTVQFNEVVLNQGNGYDSTTGVFTVPSGGDGVYFFSTYLLVYYGEYAWFALQLNDDAICTTYGDHNNSGEGDAPQATCSAVVSVVEGDEVKLVLGNSDDDTPLYAVTNYLNGFNGFRI